MSKAVVRKIDSAEIQGKREYMEDRKALFRGYVRGRPVDMIGVFDGHAGSRCAQVLKEKFLPFLFQRIQPALAAIMTSFSDRNVRNLEARIQSAFVDFDAIYFPCEESGSTASVVILADVISHFTTTPSLFENRQCQNSVLCISCHAGDSRTGLFTPQGVVFESKDHKPGDAAEKKRIEEAGGRVVVVHGVPRVEGNLAVSRGFGDRMLKPPVSAVPTCNFFCASRGTGGVIATDGLFDLMNMNEVYKRLRQAPPAELVKSIAPISHDNVTVVTFEI